MTNKNDIPKDKKDLQIWGYILLIVAIVAVMKGIPSFKDEGAVIIGIMMGFASGIMFNLSKGKTLLKDGLKALIKPVLLSLLVYLLSLY